MTYIDKDHSLRVVEILAGMLVRWKPIKSFTCNDSTLAWEFDKPGASATAQIRPAPYVVAVTWSPASMGYKTLCSWSIYADFWDGTLPPEFVTFMDEHFRREVTE